MSHDIFALLTDPFASAARRLGAQAPSLAAAFILLLVGMFLARGLRTAAERLASLIRLDEHTSRVGINEVLARLGLGKSPSFALSFLLYWVVIFLFIVSAANAVNLTIVSDLLERFVLFLPSLVAALLIIFGGLLFARFLFQVVLNASGANNIRGGSLLAHLAYLVVIVFSAMTALEQLGMKTAFIAAAVQILLGSAGLAAAIAFGLGAKESAGEFLRNLFKRG